MPDMQKLFDLGKINLIHHYHVIQKYRVSAHWSCSSNLKLTKNVPVKVMAVI